MGPQGRLGGARAGAARPADDPRRDDRHRLRAARGRVRRPDRAALHLRGRRHDARMGGPAPRRDRRGLRLRRDRGLVLPAAAGRRPPGGQTAHRRPPAAAHAGDRRLRPVGAEAADRARLGPRRAGDDELAGDALDDRRGGAARAAPGDRRAAERRPAAARPRRRPARAPAPPELAGSAPCSPSGSRSAPSASFRASSWPCRADPHDSPAEPLRRAAGGRWCCRSRSSS